MPVAYRRQAIAPSHRLSVPQLAAPMSVHMLRGSVAPLATGEHRPAIPGSAQLRQAPVHAVLQQIPAPAATLRTQCRFMQSASAVHAWPSTLGPHRPATHAMPSAQSALVAHFELHAMSAQRYVPHARNSEASHVPSPSHARAVFIAVTPEQTEGPQGLLGGYCSHVPNPSQTPVVPQVDGASVAQSG